MPKTTNCMCDTCIKKRLAFATSQGSMSQASTGTATLKPLRRASRFMALIERLGLPSQSHERMKNDLDTLHKLLERVKTWKSDGLTDEKIRFETAAALEVNISKVKLALHLEDLDSILLKTEDDDDDLG